MLSIKTNSLTAVLAAALFAFAAASSTVVAAAQSAPAAVRAPSPASTPNAPNVVAASPEGVKL
ncbi:MAG: hypothetical protein ABSD67_00440 [Terracidiphilus sp.]